MIRKLLLVLVAVLFWVAPTLADGFIIIPHPPRPIPGHFNFAPLEVSYHHVTCAIDDQHAVTTVDQEFYNPNNSRLEGEYIFPLPKGSRIDKFTMDIDGKPVEAELLDAEKARKIYEDIVRKMKDPALLEYSQRDVFRVRIFPIEPMGRKRIQLKYSELLMQDGQMLHYHYTLSTEKFSSKPLNSASVKVTVNSPLPITSIYSPSHTVDINRKGDKSATVGWEAKDTRPDTDFHLYIGRKADTLGMNLLTFKPEADKDGYFLLLASPVLKTQPKAMPKDVIFVMDTSGSMMGDKLDQAKRALKYCVGSLNPEDRFELIRFSTEAEAVLGQLTNADKANRDKALAFIDGMKAAGGTAIEEAVGKALEMVPRDGKRLTMIVFITDGLPTIGERDPDRLLAKFKAATGATRIFTFGIGSDVNTKLLDQVAETSHGYSQYVLPKEDIEVAISSFMAKVQDPILTKLKLDFTGITTSHQYPRELPDLFKGDQLLVMGTYRQSGNSAAVLTCQGAATEEKFAQDFVFPAQTDSSNEWIAKLWAARRVSWLLEQIRINGESKELKEEITDLARRWGIVTPYTALLIIEDERGRNVPVAQRSLREMEGDGWAMQRTEVAFDAARKGTQSGGNSVSMSVNNDGLRRADNLAQLQDVAGQKSERLQAPAAPGQASAPAMTKAIANGASNNQDQGYRVVQNYAQQNRTIKGLTFYQNGNQWVDQRTQKMPTNATRQKIAFNSEAYFELLRKNPEVGQWLALGTEVSFQLGDSIIDIVPEP
jgi:Ca-activated chloride channel family protein